MFFFILVTNSWCQLTFLFCPTGNTVTDSSQHFTLWVSYSEESWCHGIRISGRVSGGFCNWFCAKGTCRQFGMKVLQLCFPVFKIRYNFCLTLIVLEFDYYCQISPLTDWQSVGSSWAETEWNASHVMLQRLVLKGNGFFVCKTSPWPL